MSLYTNVLVLEVIMIPCTRYQNDKGIILKIIDIVIVYLVKISKIHIIYNSDNNKLQICLLDINVVNNCVISNLSFTCLPYILL